MGSETPAIDAARRTLFDGIDWIDCCLSHPPLRDRRPRLIVPDSGEGNSAVQPLSWGRETIYRVPARTYRSVGDPLSDRITLGSGSDHPAAVLRPLLAAPDPWDVVILNELVIDENGRESVIRWASDNGLGINWERCSWSPVVNLVGHDRESLKSTYRKSLRVRLQRARKKLRAAGHVAFERMLPKPADVPALIAQMKRIEDISWKGQRSVGIFSSDDRRSLFQSFAERLASRQALDISFLSLDEQPISYRFGFRHNNAYLDYNLAFDPVYASLSPGRVLLDEIVLSSVDEELAAVDASRGSLVDPHLLSEWTDDGIDHYALWLFAPTLRGRALSILRNEIRPRFRSAKPAIRIGRR